jgi:hypothetical protein
LGLKVNKFKTQEMRVKPSTDLVLTVNGRQVEPVKSRHHDRGALDCVLWRVKKAAVALMQLYPVWMNKNILVTTKILLLHTYVKSFLLYWFAIWKITERISNSL